MLLELSIYRDGTTLSTIDCGRGHAHLPELIGPTLGPGVFSSLKRDRNRHSETKLQNFYRK